MKVAPIPAWQLAARFALEVASLIAIGRYAASRFIGLSGYVAAWVAPAIIAVCWATFAVKGDPSRSGKAPVPIPGVLRLVFELAVFLGGAAALAARSRWTELGLFMAVLVIHHAMTTERIRWLIRQ